MTRFLIALSIVLCLPDASLAFCGGWDAPVALGFGQDSWLSKWPILGAILLFVTVFSSLVIRQVRAMRALPAQEV